MRENTRPILVGKASWPNHIWASCSWTRHHAGGEYKLCPVASWSTRERLLRTDLLGAIFFARLGDVQKGCSSVGTGTGQFHGACLGSGAVGGVENVSRHEDPEKEGWSHYWRQLCVRVNHRTRRLKTGRGNPTWKPDGRNAVGINDGVLSSGAEVEVKWMKTLSWDDWGKKFRPILTAATEEDVVQ